MGMDDLLRNNRFEEAAESLSQEGLGVLGLVSARVAWLDVPDLLQLAHPSATAATGPVLWVQMPRSRQVEDVGESVAQLMYEVAVACEWGNARLGVGATQPAQVLVDLSGADDAVLRQTLALVWRHIARPRLHAMGGQLLGQIDGAALPAPSSLPLDHYPACWSHLMLVTPAPSATLPASASAAAEGMDQQLLPQQFCRAVAPVWRVTSALANIIPLADTLACAFLLDSDTRARTHVAIATGTLRARLQLLRGAVAAAAVPPLSRPLHSASIARWGYATRDRVVTQHGALTPYSAPCSPPGPSISLFYSQASQNLGSCKRLPRWLLQEAPRSLYS